MLSADIKNNNIKLFIDVEKTMPSKNTQSNLMQ